MNKPIQTRSEENGIVMYETLEAAFAASEKDLTIWKISFTLNDERVRLVREQRSDHGTYGSGELYVTNYWKFEQIS